MALTLDQRQRLFDAVVDKFLPSEFDELLFIRLGLRPYLVGPAGSPLPQFLTEVLMHARANEWEEELIVAAADAKPRNQKLRLLADEIVTTSYREPLPALQLRLQKHDTLVKAAPWRMMLEEHEARVCKIIVPISNATITGTGFLVGPDLVMTNHHVLRTLLEPGPKETTTVERVRFRFDYKTLRDGRTATAGVEYSLDPYDWNVIAMPPSPYDFEVEPKSGTPAEDHLDFAIVRLSSPAGDHAVGANRAIQGSEPRGYVRIPNVVAAIQPSVPLVVLQHPDGRPLEIAWSVAQTLNGNGTRLKHSVDTEGGSSGSPVFDLQWNLLALHHSGDPAYWKGLPPSYNEAIPISKIKEALTRGGVTLPAPT